MLSSLLKTVTHSTRQVAASLGRVWWQLATQQRSCPTSGWSTAGMLGWTGPVCSLRGKPEPDPWVLNCSADTAGAGGVVCKPLLWHALWQSVLYKPSAYLMLTCLLLWDMQVNRPACIQQLPDQQCGTARPRFSSAHAGQQHHPGTIHGHPHKGQCAGGEL